MKVAFLIHSVETSPCRYRVVQYLPFLKAQGVDLAFHIGSTRTTGWGYVIGYQVEQDKWYTIPLAEIRRMDFRIVENDPKTGLPSPLYIKVTKKDKSTIDLLNAKSASFAGHVGPAETVCIWNHLIERIEIRGE